jgi:ROK family protein
MMAMAASAEHDGFQALLDGLLPEKPKPSEKVSQQVLGAVLQELAIAAPDGCLRSDLLKRVGPGDGETYSAATLSKALAALLDKGLISKRTSSAGPNGGRPPELYMLGSQRWAMVGVHISISKNRPSKVTCTVRDLSARLIRSSSKELGRDREWSDVAVEVAGFVNQMTREWQQGQSSGEILGVGVEVPGHVHRGKVLQAPHAGYKMPLSAPLAREISDKLDKHLTVVLDNDVNLIALRETYRPDTRRRSQDGAVVAVFDEGVGAGLLVDGRVHRGHSGAAGEPGHIPVFVGPGDPRVPQEVPDLPTSTGKYPTFADPCTCKKLHHVDCYAIPERIAGELGRPLTDFALLAGGPACDTDGDLTPAGQAFWTAGAALGYGIVSLIHTHNPGWLLLLLPPALAAVDLQAADPRRGTAATLYRQAIETIVEEHAFSSTALDIRAAGPGLEVRASAGDPDGGPEKAARNAAVRVLDEFIAHALKRDECVREQSEEVSPEPHVEVDGRKLYRERRLALERDLRAILKQFDPEDLIGAGAAADEYFSEESEMSRLVMDQTLTGESVRTIWLRSFGRSSKLLADEGKLGEFTRELLTLQTRWISGRLPSVGRYGVATPR